MWMMAEVLDARLDEMYRQYGKQGVDWVLMNEDMAEHVMSRIGAQIAYMCCGDRRVYDALVSTKPPGESDIVPAWALSEARDHSKQLFNQECRVQGVQRPAARAAASPPAAPGQAAAAGKAGAKPRVRNRGKFRQDGTPPPTPEK